MRFLEIVIFAATALFLSGCIVNGAEAPCRGSVAQLTKSLAEPANQGAVLNKLTDKEVAGLVENFGPPPVEFDAMYLLEVADQAIIIITKGDCIEYNGEPHPLEDWQKRLGRVPA